jgi:hypothetical protein
MSHLPTHPFLLSVEDTAQALETDLDKGLSPGQVAHLQQTHARNEFEIGGAIAWYTILSKQLFNAMILVSPPWHRVLDGERGLGADGKTTIGSYLCHGPQFCDSRSR